MWNGPGDDNRLQGQEEIDNEEGVANGRHHEPIDRDNPGGRG